MVQHTTLAYVTLSPEDIHMAQEESHSMAHSIQALLLQWLVKL